MMHLILINILFVSLGVSQSCQIFSGKTYRIEIDYGTFVAYELVTFHRHHRIVSIIDNTENGFSLMNNTMTRAFSSQTGQWRCQRRNRIDIRTVNFNYQVGNNATPTTLSINRMTLLFSNQWNNVQGNYTFAYHDLDVDPTDENARPVNGVTYGPYRIIGRHFRFF